MGENSIRGYGVSEKLLQLPRVDAEESHGGMRDVGARNRLIVGAPRQWQRRRSLAKIDRVVGVFILQQIEYASSVMTVRRDRQEGAVVVASAARLQPQRAPRSMAQVEIGNEIRVSHSNAEV
jgi:hypothetical protein